MYYKVEQDPMTGLYDVLLVIRDTVARIGRYAQPELAQHRAQILTDRSQQRELELDWE